jgi:ubiquinone biosynthesis protein UbiJ
MALTVCTAIEQLHDNIKVVASSVAVLNRKLEEMQTSAACKNALYRDPTGVL